MVYYIITKHPNEKNIYCAHITNTKERALQDVNNFYELKVTSWAVKEEELALIKTITKWRLDRIYAIKGDPKTKKVLFR